MNGFKKYANSFQTVINLGLGRIELLLEKLNNPHRGLKYIHIAGTNAKGSVCAFLESALIHSGKKTGKYTSPNLIRVNERVTVNGEPIPDDTMNKYLKIVETASDIVEKELGEYPSQFEIWTAMAFLYFKEQKCDIVILETGLGGRFDATNVIEENCLSVITKIALDHTEYLGDTLDKIAFEKCGIIKKNSIVVSASQDIKAQEVIEKRAKEENCELIVAPIPKEIETKEIYEKYDDIFLSLGGVHQLENASIAECALKALGISEESIRYGLSHAYHPARFELIGKNPYVIFDGGHNPNGIEALKKGLIRYFGAEKKTFICAFMKDKDIEESLEILKDITEEILFVSVKNNERSAKEEQLLGISDKLHIKATYFDDIKDAYSFAVNKNKTVVICGSLYLYKDMSEIMLDF